MTLTAYKIIAALLGYPRPESQQLLAEAPAMLDGDPLADRTVMRHLRAFIKHYAQMPLIEWQQRYVDIFDYTPATTLYLFDHVYGSSRKRGQAMSQLIDMYAGAGLEIANNELPDYLPVYVEYASTAPDAAAAAAYMADIAPVLDVIRKPLKAQDTAYDHLIAILQHWAKSAIPHPSPL